ncbi:unnamed protein product [Microthlaspi erraticum]|uniref:Uncharacterized protein n=1 Tax=Microthlaspi erraticum TaxID=1685480 RepID=A0A6D2IW18_9BRAS|nr:unnamed protein product [Microthlaspi erraticum]
MARRQSDCLTKYLLNTYATPFQCVAARGCGARGRGAEAVVAELEAVEVGPRLWTSADSGESVVPSVATASVTQSGLDDLVVGLLTQLLARFPPVVPQGAPGVPPVAEVQQRAAGFVQPQAVGLMVPSYLDMLGHMQRIGMPYFEGGVSQRRQMSGVRDWSGISSLSDFWFSTRLSWQSTI